MFIERSEINNSITSKIKRTVRSSDDAAQIILYGSRTRGDARKDSDWDILILLNKPKATLNDEQQLRHKLHKVELETGEVISTFVYSKDDWNSKLSVTPFYQNVIKDGIQL